MHNVRGFGFKPHEPQSWGYCANYFLSLHAKIFSPGFLVPIEETRSNDMHVCMLGRKDVYLKN